MPMSTQVPGRRAIALEYDGSTAPKVTAIGDESVAERIIAIAREHGVPMVENNELATLLAQLELGDQIPETLYLCVAQIIAFAYTLRGRYPAQWQGDAGADTGDWVDADATEAALLPGPLTGTDSWQS